MDTTKWDLQPTARTSTSGHGTLGVSLGILTALEPLHNVFLMTTVMAILTKYQRVCQRTPAVVFFWRCINLQQAYRAFRQAIRAIRAIRPRRHVTAADVTREIFLAIVAPQHDLLGRLDIVAIIPRDAAAHHVVPHARLETFPAVEHVAIGFYPARHIANLGGDQGTDDGGRLNVAGAVEVPLNELYPVGREPEQDDSVQGSIVEAPTRLFVEKARKHVVADESNGQYYALEQGKVRIVEDFAHDVSPARLFTMARR